jgi:hypothetical protein
MQIICVTLKSHIAGAANFDIVIFSKRLIFSKRELGKCKTVGEVNAIKSKKLREVK